MRKIRIFRSIVQRDIMRGLKLIILDKTHSINITVAAVIIRGDMMIRENSLMIHKIEDLMKFIQEII